MSRPGPTSPSRRTAFAPGCRCPRCGKVHQSWRAVAACRWFRSLWIIGNPPAVQPCYATVSFCRHGGRGAHVTVILHADEADAREALAGINRLGCGGMCSRLHQLVILRPAMEASVHA